MPSKSTRLCATAFLLFTSVLFDAGSARAAGPWGGSLLWTLAGQLPPGEHVAPNGLGEEAGFVSAPRVHRPFFICSDVISVSGLIVGANLEVEAEIGGQAYVVSAVSIGTVMEIQLARPFETTSDWVRARQKLGSELSSWDRGSTSVDNHAMEVSTVFPNGLPIPTAYYEPFYDCGSIAGMTSFVSGARAWMSAVASNGTPRIFFDYPRHAFHAAEGGTGQFFAGEKLEANYDFCGETMHSNPTYTYNVVPRPVAIGDLPPPWIDEVFQDDALVTVNGLLHGATAAVYDSGGHLLGTQATPHTYASVHVNRALLPGEQLQAKQIFSGCDESDGGPFTAVQPCTALRAAEIARPAPGDEEVLVTRSQPLALILIKDAAGTLIGRGVAPVVELSRPLLTTEEIRVTQRLGSCDSSTAFSIHVDCGPKSRGELDLLQQLSDRRRRRGTTNLVATECK